MDAARRFGDVVYLKIGPRRGYLITNPADIRHVLQDNARNYHKSPLYQKLKMFLGDGLLTSEDEFWLRQRRIAQPAFHRQKVAELRAAFEGYAEAAPNDGDNLDRLRAKDAFYKVLFEGAASEPLTEMLTMLQSRVRLLRWTSLSVPGRAEETAEEMRTIVEAIEAKDPTAAAEACAPHRRRWRSRPC